MTRSGRVGPLLALPLLFAALGCGASKPLPVPVSGTVTLDGQPLADGTVYFKTVRTGALDAVPVKDGKFDGRAEEGERRVEVTAYRTKVVGSGAMVGEVKESLVAARFNRDSTLTATVTRAGPNVFEFKVTGK